MRLATAFLALGLALGGASAASAESFDGKWISDMPSQGGRCNFTSVMALVVAGDAISGEVTTPGVRHPIAGKLEPDGIANFTVDHRLNGTMTFRGDHFEANWNNGNCDRHAEGDRAPDAARMAALAADRKRHQDAYADLVRRASAGEDVDYNRLRAESVYAPDWDFYDSKARGLLDQANAAVKGKDCGAAMPLLDRVLKLDFTIDSAHSLRSDCLKKAGQGDQAHIEDAIAKGLIHSLMDGYGGNRGIGEAFAGGGGRQVDAAYVVHTYREEMDVLANRHIQIRSRETEVRGSDGRYYDRVQGISISAVPGYVSVGSRSISSSSGHVDLDPRSLYFDISSFVEGRVSKRAAAEVLAAQLR